MLIIIDKYNSLRVEEMFNKAYINLYVPYIDKDVFVGNSVLITVGKYSHLKEGKYILKNLVFNSGSNITSTFEIHNIKENIEKLDVQGLRDVNIKLLTDEDGKDIIYYLPKRIR